jgi:carbonic anhydrase
MGASRSVAAVGLAVAIGLSSVSLASAEMGAAGRHGKEHAGPEHAQRKGEREQHREIHWSYAEKELGKPENWGKIKGEFAACRSGKYQSPINIKLAEKADLDDLHMRYKSTPLKILNNGHTVQVNYQDGSTMQVGKKVYNLLQFHFHTPSENHIDGEQFDMELHFVHKSNEGDLGVLGVMIKEGRHNAEAEKIWSRMPMQQKDEVTYGDVMINGAALLPASKVYYRFMGSLTTPPCTEGVNWHVLKQPIEFSRAQIDKFRQAFPVNARPVQEANSRIVILETEK